LLLRVVTIILWIWLVTLQNLRIVQLKGVGEVQEASTALEMPGNTMNTMRTRERLDRTGRNKANVSRSGLRKEGERSPRLELGLG
jgi:hypothetical protein